MTMKKTGTAPAKAATTPAPERPAAPAALAKDPRRPVMSADLKLQLDPPRATPFNRGPQVGEGSMSPGAFIQAHGSSEELGRFAAEVRARQAKERETWTFSRCSNPRCRFVMKHKPEPDGSICPSCNLARLATGGHLYAMDEKATNAYLYELARKEKAEEERLRRAAFNERNLERAKSGLAPLTMEAFKLEQRRIFEEMKQRGQDLGKVAAAFRRQP